MKNCDCSGEQTKSSAQLECETRVLVARTMDCVMYTLKRAVKEEEDD